MEQLLCTQNVIDSTEKIDINDTRTEQGVDSIQGIIESNHIEKDPE
jgi:hypothetical protein